MESNELDDSIESVFGIESTFKKLCMDFSIKVFKKLGNITSVNKCSKLGLDDVYNLSEIAYMLSTTHEEACYISCRIGFVKNEFIQAVCSKDNDSFMFFDKPISLNLEKLRKLAISADPQCSMLLVQKTEQNQYIFVGIYTFSNELNKIKRSEIRIDNIGDPIFNIYIKEPGKIEACVGAESLVKWGTDNITENIWGTIIENCDIVREKFSFSGKPIQQGNSCFYNTVIEMIVRYIEELKHGGTLLVIKHNDVAKNGAHLNVKYKVRNKVSISKLVKDWQKIIDKKGHKITPKEEYTFRKIDSFCHFIAHLSCVDGAVIINQNLSILGFGAEITMPESSSVDNYPVYNIREGKEELLIDKGTRHRSAYRFCKSVSTAVAFVISQDGGVSCFTKSTNKTDSIPGNKVCVYKC